MSEKVNIKHPIDAHNIAIHEDPFYPDAYIIGLPLDSDPSYVWQRLFEQELCTSLDFWDRKVAIVGRELKLVTTRDRVGEKLGWLEDLMTATNRRVDEYNNKINAEKQAIKHEFANEEAIRKDLVSWQLRRVSG